MRLMQVIQAGYRKGGRHDSFEKLAVKLTTEGDKRASKPSDDEIKARTAEAKHRWRSLGAAPIASTPAPDHSEYRDLSDDLTEIDSEAIDSTELLNLLS